MTGNQGLRWHEPHLCCLCQKVFSERSGLRNHLEKHHFKSKKIFCDLCPNFYFTKGCMVRHMKAAHMRIKFVCKICNYRTSVKSHLKRHKQVHQPKVECPTCNRRVTSLSKHMRGHKQKENCPICKKMIDGRGLIRHLETHKRVKIMTQKCGFVKCRERFETAQELKT